MFRNIILMEAWSRDGNNGRCFVILLSVLLILINSDLVIWSVFLYMWQCVLTNLEEEKNKYFKQFSFCANRTKHLWQPKVKLYENGNIEKADIPSPLWLSQETFSMTAAAGGITRVKIRFNLTSNRNKLPITKNDSVPFLFLLY